MVHAVGPLGDELAHLALGGVEYVGDDPLERAGLVDSQKLADAAGGDVDRSYLRVQVAQEVFGVANVGGEHLQQVAARLPAVVDAQWRDAQALVVDFAGRGVVAAVGGAAYVAVVRAVDRVEEQLALMEDGPDDGYVRQVAAAEIGVVEGEEVARRDVVAEVVAHRRARDGQGAYVHGDALALRDELAVGVQNGGREVAAGVEDLGHGGAQHHLHHLHGDGLQAILHHGEGNGIGRTGRRDVVFAAFANGDTNRHAAEAVERGSVALVDEHGGEVGLQDRRSFYPGVAGKPVYRVHGHVAPFAQEHTASSLWLDRAVGGRVCGQVGLGQTAQRRYA